MIDWTHLPFLLAASRAGTLAGAARALRVDPATVGRHVAALEHELGAKLFRRKKGGGLEPTEIGARLLAAASRTEEGLSEAVRVVRAEDARPSGIVRLTTVDILATGFVVPRLPALHARYPELVVDLLVTPQILDLSRDVDLALRLARPKDEALVTRRAGTLSLGVYASAAYVERHGPIRRNAARLDVVQYGEQFLRVPENRWLDELVDPRTVLRTTSVGSAIAAAEAGLAAAMIPIALADRSPSLVRLPALGSASRDVWIAVHPDLAKSPRVRAVADFLVDAVAAAEPRSRRRS